MIDDTIVKLFDRSELARVMLPITSVSGGFMHQMFKVDTSKGSYAVKFLNPEVMKRPDAMNNYLRAEKLERILEAENVPILPALTIDGNKMQEYDGRYFYIFQWLNGNTTDWNAITKKQCKQAGHIQGRIHAIQSKNIEHIPTEICAIDWIGYVKEAKKHNSIIAPILEENIQLLEYAQDAVNTSRKALPDLECIIDEDMDPKNVMWVNDKPVVIDLECLDYGNPVSAVLQLSLQWSGITTCNLDLDLQKAFFEGYLEAYDNGFRDYADVCGLAYTWIEWLEYNINRSLGDYQDEKELEMGIAEVKNTVKRLRYIREHECAIRHNLEHLFDWSEDYEKLKEGK